MTRQDPMIIIVGPTGIGKSHIAMNLAKQLNGSIINADCMQLYKDLRILTARPSIEDEQIIPHYLYGELLHSDQSSAEWWAQKTVLHIQSIYKKKRLPILVGGTGFYIHTLMHGLSSIPTIPPETHESVKELSLLKGSGFYDIVCKVDSNVIGRIHPHDTQRLCRVLEVKRATGVSLFQWQTHPRKPCLSSPFIYITFEKERYDLYKRIDQRFIEMIQEGGLDEAQLLFDQKIPSYSPVCKALGVQELWDYFEGKCSISLAIQNAQKVSRHYAKRQMTWFRNQKPTSPYCVGEWIQRDENISSLCLFIDNIKQA